MIGCYIHHQGNGHLHRTLAWAQHLGESVTGLSSMAAPDNWPGGWVQLASDWPTDGTEATDPTASGQLHWAPLGHPGLQERTHQISAWIHQQRPELIIVDVSVEVALLARLHGVPVVTVALPGDRQDPTHRLGFEISTAVVAFWPEGAQKSTTPKILRGYENLVELGGISRFDSRLLQAHDDVPHHRSDRPRITVLNGRGGGGISSEALDALQAAAPDSQLKVLGSQDGTWVTDPWAELVAADVVVASCGQNSVAEIAASRTPAVLVAQQRPHGEQRRMHQVLTTGPWPAVAAPDDLNSPAAWAEVLTAALHRDGHDWTTWNDGQAAERFCRLIAELRSSSPTPRDKEVPI